MQFLKTLAWVLVAVLVAIIAGNNWRDVTIDLWSNLQADIKIPVLLLGVFLLGFLPTWLAMRGKLWRLERRVAVHVPAIPAAPPPRAAGHQWPARPLPGATPRLWTAPGPTATGHTPPTWGARRGRTRCGVRHRTLGDQEAAEGVAQDAFHSVWRQARTYRHDRGSVRTWLLAIGRNAAIDWRRNKGRRIERETVIEEAAELVIESRVEDRVIARLQAERVRHPRAPLPPDDRTAVTPSRCRGRSGRVSTADARCMANVYRTDDSQ